LAKGTVKSAERVLLVLEHFRTTQRPAFANELRRALDMPQSSASMLLRSLVTLGYLDYSPATRTFIPTLRVALLGDWLFRQDPVASPLVTALKALHEETGETVILGRQNGAAHVQYISVLQADQGLQLAVRVGVLRPMTITGIGRVLLASKPIREVKLIVRRNNAEAPASWRVNEREFLSSLEKIRSCGYAMGDALITPGATTVSMLLPVATGDTPLAVGVGGPVERLQANFPMLLKSLQRHVAEFQPAVPPGDEPA
jgi:IclR family acetate operon transcriptional repressor